MRRRRRSCPYNQVIRPDRRTADRPGRSVVDHSLGDKMVRPVRVERRDLMDDDEKD